MQLLDRSFDVSTTPVAGATLSLEAIRGVEQFLFREARLLDERKFAEWLALWTEDGRYWVPRFHDQANPFEQISLFWEDKMLREVRVRRVENARNWSQQPLTRSAHLVGNITIEGLDAAGHLIVRSTLQLTEWRIDQRQLAGSVFHKLAATEDGGWKIVLKRVNLVNCDDVFANLEVFI
ncbi:aromatic-ring-hydroxylating dioxygenase subunit beta [Azoarcus indigens]|uniref:3-phenylpropionate/cinnamic acid dioxygenase small subunit n=1 Tax=Azoarcus indigens TaxID=29545 RepID=A0A4R6DXG4_9RHOO|nr:aromatic-ring-hydroxylating dioxygenase subunit beta [Azoarcus indigens]NMG65641.1 aromatic-ring-hydroxylating dioxygenase subunit beta [Azoarcus indigens]TDN49953.1 3-phenylpropionate/cinnamic acid dioxygenase small subunit [Azoarcus indigens]